MRVSQSLIILAGLTGFSNVAFAQDPPETPAEEADVAEASMTPVERVEQGICNAIEGAEYKLAELALNGEVGWTCDLPNADQHWLDVIAGATSPDGSRIEGCADGIDEMVTTDDLARIEHLPVRRTDECPRGSRPVRRGGASGLGKKAVTEIASAKADEAYEKTKADLAATAAQLSAETATEAERAKAAEAALQSAVDTETARAKAEEARIEGKVDAETDRAMMAEAVLWQKLDGIHAVYFSLSAGIDATFQPAVNPLYGSYVQDETSGEWTPVFDENGDQETFRLKARGPVAVGPTLNTQIGVRLGGGRIGLDGSYTRVAETGETSNGESSTYWGNLFAGGFSGAAQIADSPVGIGGFANGTYHVSGANPAGSRVVSQGFMVGPLVDVAVPVTEGIDFLVEARAGIGSDHYGMTVIQATGASAPFDDSGLQGKLSLTGGFAF